METREEGVKSVQSQQNRQKSEASIFIVNFKLALQTCFTSFYCGNTKNDPEAKNFFHSFIFNMFWDLL